MERFALVAFLAASTPLAAAAQRITITPTMGVYLPLRDQGHWREAACSHCSNLRTYRLELRPGVDVGLKLSADWDGFGLEAAIASATLERHTGYDGTDTHPARNTVATLRLLFRRPMGRWDIAFAGGLSHTTLTSSSYCSNGQRCITDLTRWGVTPNVTLGVPLGANTRLEFNVANHIYSVRFPPQGGAPPPPQPPGPSPLQLDLVLSGGIGFVFRP